MKVSTSQPFQIVYSIYHHEYLGYLFASFIVQLNSKGELTYQRQNISTHNSNEFNEGLDEKDHQLIKIIETIQHEYIIKHYYNKKVKPAEFFLKVYDPKKGDKLLQEKIEEIIEEKKQKIIQLLKGKMLFVMGRDGNPIWKRINFADEPVTVYFNFMRNEDNTHYFPTLKYKDQKLNFQYQNAFILANKPAWLVLENTIYRFHKNVDGNKLKPFLNKKFIAIPKNMESTYYEKFVAPLLASFDVYSNGFEVTTQKHIPEPVLTMTEFHNQQVTLFGEQSEDFKIKFDLSFKYGEYALKAEELNEKNMERSRIKVKLEKKGDAYTFYKLKRDIDMEKNTVIFLSELGLDVKKGYGFLNKGQAFWWVSNHAPVLEKKGIRIQQNTNKKYFLGKADIKLEIRENLDWFDIYAQIRFGDYEIPFMQLRKLILSKKTEFLLPNGEIAVIPDRWIEEYTELFTFAENTDDSATHQLKKHHLQLINELKNGNAAQVTIQRKLEKFREFEDIEDIPLPDTFKGVLRPYQKAGYNWLNFLQQYRFGGCLADDMGLGKTVMTLALLAAHKQAGKQNASLLVMPTSLIYNWELESCKFTPELRVLIYSGSNRKKSTQNFNDYDLVITSYGITRIDLDILKGYLYNYIILDESQAIKNPESNISQAVRQLHGTHRLILTGTPLENSTMDLWSQISFINPGLLGTSSYFKNEYQLPIEKRNDAEKMQKLGRIIKPFVLRRIKSQVALDLPDKIEHVQYCTMSEKQEDVYEKVKSQYRNEIIRQIENQGIARSQLLILQGLTKLRQIANHPKMVMDDYPYDSGKLEDIQYKLESILSEHHKVLVFSQFVKHLTILRQYLDQNQVPYAYLDGSTRDRQGQVENFQNKDALRIFLISLKAGGVGLNLTAADYVFVLDPWWNPAIESQAIDRAHRIGQKNTVFTYKFITRNTVEEKILQLQEHKKRLASELITSEEGFVKSLSKEDVLHLLE